MSLNLPNLPRFSAVIGLALVVGLAAGCKKAVVHHAPPAASASTAAKTAAPAATAIDTAALFHSYFNDAPPPGNIGRDPFFPNSNRRNPPDLKPVATTSTAPAVHVEPVFRLGAIVGSSGKRLAVINSSYILTEGEEADMRTSNGKVHVKVLKIDENSVDLKVEGESGQIHLELSQPKSP